MSPHTSASVFLPVDLIFEDVDFELAVLGRQLRRRHRLTSDSVRVRYVMRSATVIISSPCFFANLRQLRHPRHRAVFVHDLADDAGRIETRDPRQVDRRLGLSGAHHHAAGPRAQRKHVAGPRRSARSGRRIDRRQHGCGAIGRRNAGRRAAPRFDRHAERGVESRAVLRDHQRNLELVEPLRRHRQTDQSAAVPRHEVDGLRRDLLRRDRQVAFVLAILIVDDDDHLAGADGVERVFDAGEGRTLPDRAFGDVHAFQCVTSPGRTVLSVSPASSAARTTYFPTMSHSRLTRSRTLRAPQIGVLHRERHHLHVEAIRAEPRHRQADAVHRDRPLVHDIGREMRRKADREPVKVGVAPQVLDPRRWRPRAPARSGRRSGRRRAAAARD